MRTTQTLGLMALSAGLVVASSNPGSNSTINGTEAIAAILCPASENSTYTCGDTIFDVKCSTDLFDHDLRTVYTATMNDCMTACTMDGQCVAVSYDNPGACYLKYAIGMPIPNPRIWSAVSNAIEVIPSCPTSNQTSYYASKGKAYLIECDIDHFDNDFKEVYAADLQGCIAACESNAECVDVVLSGTACYLKNAVGASEYKPGSGLAGAKCVAGCPAPAPSSSSTTTSATPSPSSSTGGSTTVSTASSASSSQTHTSSQTTTSSSAIETTTAVTSRSTTSSPTTSVPSASGSHFVPSSSIPSSSGSSTTSLSSPQSTTSSSSASHTSSAAPSTSSTASSSHTETSTNTKTKSKALTTTHIDSTLSTSTVSSTTSSQRTTSSVSLPSTSPSTTSTSKTRSKTTSAPPDSPTPIECPDAAGDTVTVKGRNFGVQCYIAYAGTQIANTSSVQSFADCMAMCPSGTCVAATYLPDSLSCSTYSGLGKGKSDANTWFAKGQ